MNIIKFMNNFRLYILLYYKYNIPLYLQAFYSSVFLIFSKIILFKFYMSINLISHEKSHLVISHFHFDFNVRKKRKVRNILIINNLYINIYFFCYQFIEK